MNKSALSVHFGKESIGWAQSRTSVGLWRLPKGTDDGVLGAALIDALGQHNKLLEIDAIVVSRHDEPDLGVRDVGLRMCVMVFCARRRISYHDTPTPEVLYKAMLGRADLPPAKLDAALRSFARRSGLAGVSSETAHALMVWEWFAQQQREEAAD